MNANFALRLCSIAVVLGCVSPACASWTFSQSYFSHAPTGERVTQYAEPAPAYARVGENYLQSGYRHNEIVVGRGAEADHIHVVETWGDGQWIRPYGEWQFPYRAGATPYGPWGNPQGPWTTPFDSWRNPFGAGRQFPFLQVPPWGVGPAVPGGM